MRSVQINSVIISKKKKKKKKSKLNQPQILQKTSVIPEILKD